MLELLGPPARDIESPVARNTEVHANDLTPVLEELRRMASLRSGPMLARRGGRWWVSNVRNLLVQTR
jgi:hypothetical protein